MNEKATKHAAKSVEITDPVLLIRINKLYRHGMSAQELYEATRGIWKLGPRREGASYAFAVFEGLVREVYEIHDWYPAGTTKYETREVRQAEDRQEFEGRVVPEEVRRRYVGRSVVDYFPKGSQNPFRYVNC